MKTRGWWVIVWVIGVMLGSGPVVHAQDPTPAPGLPDDLVPITAANADQLTLLMAIGDPEHDRYVERVAFSATGDWLFSEHVLAEILMWSVETGELWLVLQDSSSDYAPSLVVNPARDSVAFNISADIFTWDGQHHDQAAVSACGTLAFSPDGSLLACQSPPPSDDSRIQLWHVEEWTHETTLSVEPRYPLVVFTPDGNRIVLPIAVRDPSTQQVNRGITVWDIAADAQEATFPLLDDQDTPGFAVKSLALSPDGRVAAYTASDFDAVNVLAVRNLTTGEQWAHVTPRSRGSIGSVTFSADGSAVIAAGDDGDIHVLRAESGDELTVKSSGAETVYRVALNGAGTLLAAGTQSGVIELWGVRE